ncbi:MAG: GNAT family N-acetyltransferase [Saprospiraceae bacterium]|nr:GNAT family N-acetyltransferase [Saprospiraceae bacterium]
MKELQIRKAKTTDLEAVHQLVGDLARYEKAEEQFVATLADYQRDFEAGIFEVLVAEIDETIVGMALYYMSYSTWKGRMLWLEDFVIKESWRGKGIGQLLFDTYVEEARLKECRIVKWQVLDWNEPAVRFYEKKQAIIEKNWWNGKIFLTIPPKKQTD